MVATLEIFHMCWVLRLFWVANVAKIPRRKNNHIKSLSIQNITHRESEEKWKEKMYYTYLSIVNAVMVRTDALAENSQTNEWSTHIVVSKGYLPDPFHMI